MIRTWKGREYAYPECLSWDWKTGEKKEIVPVLGLTQAIFKRRIKGEFTCRDNCYHCNGEFSTPYNCYKTPTCPHCNKRAWSIFTKPLNKTEREIISIKPSKTEGLILPDTPAKRFLYTFAKRWNWNIIDLIDYLGGFGQIIFPLD